MYTVGHHLISLLFVNFLHLLYFTCLNEDLGSFFSYLFSFYVSK